jgi:hypothetical protein
MSHFQRMNLVTVPFMVTVPGLSGLYWSPASKGHGNSEQKI